MHVRVLGMLSVVHVGVAMVTLWLTRTTLNV